MRGIDDGVRAGTWIKNVDARVKVVSLVIFIVTATTIQDKMLLSVAAMLLLGLSLIVGISIGHIMKRLTLIVPFGGVMLSVLPFVTPGEPVLTLKLGFFNLVASREGLEAAALPCLKMITAFLGMVFLTSSTAFRDIIHALRHLRIPIIFILLIDFTIRYMAVVQDELRRMQIARKARGFKTARGLWHRHTVKTIGSTIAVLFLRAFDRSERVYYAMLSRGYGGKYSCCGHCHSIKKSDFCWGAGVIATSWCFKLIEVGGYQWVLQLK